MIFRVSSLAMTDGRCYPVLMRTLLVAIVLSALACGQPVEQTAESDEAIVGGHDDGGDPAVVAINLEATGFTICTGTLVAPDVVLTAGHCPTSGIWVRQGQDATGLGWFGHVGVKAAAKHPRFSGEGRPYDLTLLRLGKRLDGVQPIPLSAAPLSDADVGAVIRHVGYGTTGDDWHYTKAIGTGGHKRAVSYPVTKVDDFFLYSGAPGKQTCLFDSGGPALRAAGRGERLIGVVSAGTDCHSDGWDSRVDRPDVLAWIDGVLAGWGSARP